MQEYSLPLLHAPNSGENHINIALLHEDRGKY